jgi:transposase
VVTHLGLSYHSVHLDSTSFHYDDQEKLNEGDFNAISITKGYSRDHRPELNQVIRNLICENQAGIPVYMKPVSGNSNDMEGFKQIVKSHIHSLTAAQPVNTWWQMQRFMSKKHWKRYTILRNYL